LLHKLHVVRSEREAPSEGDAMRFSINRLHRRIFDNKALKGKVKKPYVPLGGEESAANSVASEQVLARQLPLLSPVSEDKEDPIADNTRSVLQQDVINDNISSRNVQPTRSSSDNSKEPVWKRRIRSARASIEQESHPFDEASVTRGGRENVVTTPSSKTVGNSIDQMGSSSGIEYVYSLPASDYAYSLPESTSTDDSSETEGTRETLMAKETSETSPKVGGDSLLDIFRRASSRVRSTVTDMVSPVESIDISSAETHSFDGSMYSSSKSFTTDASDSTEMSMYMRRLREHNEPNGCTRDGVFGSEELIDTLGSCRASFADVFSPENSCARLGASTGLVRNLD
jgi:hypothetical protein